MRFLRPVYPGDTLRAETEVLGKRETSSGDTGIVWVRTRGFNQRDERVLQFYRWAMVNKRDPETPTRRRRRAGAARAGRARAPRRAAGAELSRFDASATGGDAFWEDYEPGERIVHPQGMTIEEAEHQMATRLYQNTARVHFNQLHAEGLAATAGASSTAATSSRSRTRSRSTGWRTRCACRVQRRLPHQPDRSPATRCSPGPTCWSASTSGGRHRRAAAAPGRASRTSTPNEGVALEIADEDGREQYHPNVVLDLDYVVLMPKRAPRRSDRSPMHEGRHPHGVQYRRGDMLGSIVIELRRASTD